MTTLPPVTPGNDRLDTSHARRSCVPHRPEGEEPDEGEPLNGERGKPEKATDAWLQEYNVERPHGSLGGRSPALFFEQWEEQEREAA